MPWAPDPVETGLVDKRDTLIRLINAQGGTADLARPSPVVALEDFFEGNSDLGSIGCNLAEHPGTDTFYEVLCGVRSRTEVQDVLVEIHDVAAEGGDWPFSERIYILTTADPEEVRDWLRTLEPTEVVEGWSGGEPPAAPPLKAGIRVLGAWWD